MLAAFLHFYPQYTLEDVRRMSLGEFRLLYAGMVDTLNPEATESDEEKVERKVQEAHRRATKRRKRSGW